MLNHMCESRKSASRAGWDLSSDKLCLLDHGSEEAVTSSGESGKESKRSQGSLKGPSHQTDQLENGIYGKCLPGIYEDWSLKIVISPFNVRQALKVLKQPSLNADQSTLSLKAADVDTSRPLHNFLLLIFKSIRCSSGSHRKMVSAAVSSYKHRQMSSLPLECRKWC